MARVTMTVARRQRASDSRHRYTYHIHHQYPAQPAHRRLGGRAFQCAIAELDARVPAGSLAVM